MRKVFSLMCLFVFSFFGMISMISASTDPYMLTIEQVKTAYEARLAEEGVKYESIIYNQSTKQLILTQKINDEEELKVIFYYDEEKNWLSLSEEMSIDHYVVKALFIDWLIETIIVDLHEFTEEEYSENIQNQFDLEEPYDIQGLHYSIQYSSEDNVENTDITMSIDFGISLNSDLKYALAEALGKDIEPEDPEEPEEPTTESTTTTSSTTTEVIDNPNTSDMTIGNIIIIGGSLLLIAGYAVFKIKKMKKEGLN